MCGVQVPENKGKKAMTVRNKTVKLLQEPMILNSFGTLRADSKVFPSDDCCYGVISYNGFCYAYVSDCQVVLAVLGELAAAISASEQSRSIHSSSDCFS